jgi:hypothetical protein
MKKKVVLKSLVVLCLTALSIVGTVNIAKAYIGRPYRSCDTWRGDGACPLGYHCSSMEWFPPHLGICTPHF